MPTSQARKQRPLKRGAAAAWPICLGYLPIGLAFGVLAQKAGLSPLQIGLMSIFVFAGSSQFIAVSMLAAGASIISIVATTFIVNLRHFLMSSALAVFLKNADPKKLTFFSYGVTDESFAVNLSKFRDSQWDLNSALVTNYTANFTWIVTTVLGGIGGQFIPAHAFGIDYALIAMFICLLVFQLRGFIYIITAIIAGIFAVFLSMLIPGNSYIVIASMAAAAIGVIIKKKAGRVEGA
ncbi:MAG: AzlC family ABC transporter permease [Desulfobacteraceae bacterium]|jgi:4-azaleucine resistance transporter AzlC|nr:AzlC family ABC transporter permease [Desulfobacteraceae bacterium]